MCDLHAVLAGQFQIYLHVPLWIDHAGDLSLGAANDVGKAAHAFHGNLLKIHDFLL